MDRMGDAVYKNGTQIWVYTVKLEDNYDFLWINFTLLRFYPHARNYLDLLVREDFASVNPLVSVRVNGLGDWSKQVLIGDLPMIPTNRYCVRDATVYNSSVCNDLPSPNHCDNCPYFDFTSVPVLALDFAPVPVFGTDEWPEIQLPRQANGQLSLGDNTLYWHLHRKLWIALSPLDDWEEVISSG